MKNNKKRNSSRVNLTISAVFHGLLIATVFYFAAREGYLGKKMSTIVATLEKSVKKEPPKPEKPEVKPETPKVAEAPKPAVATQPKVETVAAPPPAEAVAAVAPAAAELPSIDFQEGAHAVDSVSDPKSAYKGMIQHALLSRWNRPQDLADDTFVAEVELTVNAAGQLGAPRWLRTSGNARWDDSVKAALAAIKSVSHAPPKGFPDKFQVRFDVEADRGEDVISLTSQ